MIADKIDDEPGRLGDFAVRMPVIIVDHGHTRTFYAEDGRFLGRYRVDRNAEVATIPPDKRPPPF